MYIQNIKQKLKWNNKLNVEHKPNCEIITNSVIICVRYYEDI